MKKITLQITILLLSFSLTSCYTEVFVDEPVFENRALQTELLLESYDLWYIDIQETVGSGEVPFLETAFTLSFNGGILTANNNLVNIGKTGSGFGIAVGNYAGLSDLVEIRHDLDGLWQLEVIPLGGNRMELYDPRSDTSYFLYGYRRAAFDYDALFYDNIHYFLQEYIAWEKIFTSDTGALNEFDQEQFLQFSVGLNTDAFRSSIDSPGTPLNLLQWDYEGFYTVYDVPGEPEMKTLTLDYNFLGDDYFELYVLDDQTIELYHVSSGTLYEFRGRGYQQILKSESSSGKKRLRKKLPEMKVSRKRPQ
ncbi:nicotinic acid mononucleotide adenyltransferase [Robiginitalea sp. IMCC44478]|uniref:nicotinic acid mononucleotide adenyltransferase n=1 Tax=Robiginitalea sp. IMCC44478 TaxID=3459122 RepID=UPI004041089F